MQQVGWVNLLWLVYLLLIDYFFIDTKVNNRAVQAGSDASRTSFFFFEMPEKGHVSFIDQHYVASVVSLNMQQLRKKRRQRYSSSNKSDARAKRCCSVKAVREILTAHT